MHATELTDEEFKRFCGLIYRVAGIRIADTKRVLVAQPGAPPAAGDGDQDVSPSITRS